MFDIGGGELILILLVILLLFGPKKIPEIAQMFGKGMQQFRRAQSQFNSQLSEIRTEINRTVGDIPNANSDNDIYNSDGSVKKFKQPDLVIENNPLKDDTIYPELKDSADKITDLPGDSPTEKLPDEDLTVDISSTKKSNI